MKVPLDPQNDIKHTAHLRKSSCPETKDTNDDLAVVFGQKSL